jgi:hypothetical protein
MRARLIFILSVILTPKTVRDNWGVQISEFWGIFVQNSESELNKMSVNVVVESSCAQLVICYYKK